MTVDTQHDVFAAIAHPVRRQILDLLNGNELTVKDIAQRFEMSRPAISQHLAILLDTGLVSRRTEGRQNVYTLQPAPLREVEQWVKQYERFWMDKLDALDDFLRRTQGNNET